ncbi:hypothetical protein AVEN_110812-1, partial [Araneus ventricosus]
MWVARAREETKDGLF